MLKMVAAILTAATLSIAVIAADNNTTNSEAYIPSEQIIIEEQVIIKEVPAELEDNLLVYVETDNINELKELMDESQERMSHAENMITAAFGCGYAEDHPIVVLANKEYEQANWCYINYLEKYNKLTIKEQSGEYPAATEIWYYFKDLGYNDYVCAGIMGNLMTEVGGHTLDIQYWLRSNTYAGMCQWSLKYTPNVPKDLIGQCDLLAGTIESAFNGYGKNYRQNFDYEAFLNLTDEKDAALAFAMCYERCAPQHYDVRAVNATIAYNYFVN